MSFQTGLSGLNASSRNLEVIGNNIANANTIGMKSSRTEFSDIVASSLGISGGSSAGIGVSVAAVSQQFSQGSISVTSNDLDIAINGGGFFQLQIPNGTDTGTRVFSRNGEFKLDKDGNILSNSGANLLGITYNSSGVATSTVPGPLTLPSGGTIAANPTSTVTAQFNLDARAVDAASVTPPTPRTTYGTSFTAYDSQGNEVPVSLYFERTTSTAADPLAVPAVAASDNWNVYDSASGGSALFQMQFNANGALISATNPTLTIATPSAVTGDISAQLDLTKVTQFGAAFSVSQLSQDGYAPGELVGLKVGDDGVISARYSNGKTLSAGQVLLFDFANTQGLTPVGNNNWAATNASGQALQGTPGAGKFGSLRAGALEESNVDLTAELVNMMTAQRSYQANAQTIKTMDQVLSTLVNLR